MGLQIAIVSNTEVSEVAGWNESPSSKMMDTTVFSHEVGHIKPDSRIYLEACNRLNTIPNLCMYVGYGGSDELNGAARVGMSPYCAAWFLGRHRTILGEYIVRERAGLYPVLYPPGQLIDHQKRNAEIGYWLGEEFQHRGIASRAVNALIEHAFSYLDLSVVIAKANSGNSRSRTLLESLGFAAKETGNSVIYEKRRD